MKYQPLKEKTPKDTIKRIKGILKKLNIEICENVFGQKKINGDNLSSLRIYLKENNKCGTNGKGSSSELAKASAYAEFMERLQTQFLFLFSNKEYLYSPDEKIVRNTELCDNPIFKNVGEKELLFKMNYLANMICFDNSSKNDDVILVPFFSYKTKKIEELPVYILSLIHGSTGLSAGNTIEEALVQGMSEICERYVQTKVINENLSLPDIPTKNYMKYEKIRKMIHLLEDNDFSILLKDASIGLDLPVICAVILDKREDVVSIKFGSHPSLPIAIERCLTEFAQGNDIASPQRCISFESFISSYALNSILKDGDINILNEKIQKGNVFIENCEYIKEQFFDRESAFSFSEETFLSVDKDTDNKVCLKFLMNKIKQITDEIFVRDVSFLGFPTVIITIPEMMFNINKKIEEKIDYRIKLQKYIDDGMPKFESNIAFLLQSFISQSNPISHSSYKSLFGIPYEHLVVLCAIFLEDFSNIKKYTEIIIKNKKSINVCKKEFITNMVIAYKYFDMKSKGLNEEQLMQNMKVEFSENDVKNFKIFLNYLSYDKLKNIISKYYLSINSDQMEKDKKFYDKVIKKIVQIYKEHCINQETLLDVFKDV